MLGTRHPWVLPRLPKPPGRSLRDTTNLFKAAPGAIQGLQSMLRWLLKLWKTKKRAIFKTPKASQTSISGSQACAVMSMLKTNKRVPVCCTHNLRSPYKILKSVFVRHEWPVYNLQDWHLCWEHTMSVQPSLCSDVYVKDRQKSVCVWHTHTPLEFTIQNTKACICEAWTTCLQSSDLASMLRTHNVCVCSIHNLSRPHKVLKSVCMTHTIWGHHAKYWNLCLWDMKSPPTIPKIGVYAESTQSLCVQHT